MLRTLKTLVHDLFSLFLPKLCLGCNGEVLLSKNCLCYACEMDLPKTYFHLIVQNPLNNRMAIGTQLKRCFALYFFESKGTMEKLLYALKYQGNKTVGLFFGKKLAAAIVETQINYDGIIGVPLHPKRKRKRGFNQVDIIGRAASEALHIPYFSEALIRTKNTPPLSKSKGERNSVLLQAFALRQPLPSQGHYLLIDDIFTTGATLDTCAKTLLSHHAISLSIATIAYRN